MKKLFDEDLSLLDVRDYVKGKHKKQKSKKVCFLITSVIVVLATLGVVLAVLKCKKGCSSGCNNTDDFEDFGSDGSGVYATESDFE